jgi:thiosulfate dehydrogenase
MPPLIGIWGQFPQYRAREGAVDTLEDRINGRMERSLNGLALPPGGREMRALSSYLRWLSTGVPDGAKLVGAGTLKIKEPSRAANLATARKFFLGYARLATGLMDRGNVPKPAPDISSHRCGVRTATTMALE